MVTWAEEEDLQSPNMRGLALGEKGTESDLALAQLHPDYLYHRTPILVPAWNRVLHGEVDGHSDTAAQGGGRVSPPVLKGLGNREQQNPQNCPPN
jgi:hypothetical protein